MKAEFAQGFLFSAYVLIVFLVQRYWVSPRSHTGEF